ncbi:Zn(II)2Cys6 transcription factor, partial [Aspergillus lucknowensis]
MLHRRACDQCAARKAKCDRRSPCRRCKALNLSCTVLREYAKPGPKGPWAHKKRSGPQAQQVEAGSLGESVAGDAGHNPDADERVSFTAIQRYLHIYSVESYSLWPVVDIDEMNTRLLDRSDLGVYPLCAALAAVTLQRQIRLGIPDNQRQPQDEGERLAAGSEKARASLLYDHRPDTDILLSSFFLHIYYANKGQISKATLLLREAITLAQLLELDQAKHYTTVSTVDVQLHLRIVWLLHITERGHATRFDFPRILHLDPNLPALQAIDNAGLLPFISMCRLFQTFGSAMDGLAFDLVPDFFLGMDTRLQTQELLANSPDSQRVDFLITKQWMRMILWKRAMFHVPLSDTCEDSLSISFPEHVARRVAAYVTDFPRGVVDSHGLGIQMKLADIAISLADVLSCVPQRPAQGQVMRIGPADILHCLAEFLVSHPNNVNPRLNLLKEKISGRVWSFPLKYPRGVDEDVRDKRSYAVANDRRMIPGTN